MSAQPLSRCWCGDEFIPNQWNHVHCSHACRMLWKSVRYTIDPKRCHCGQLYRARRRDQKHCSARCRELASRPVRNAKRKKPIKAYRCAARDCSKRFYRRRGRFQVFCSAQCRKRIENYNYNRRKRERAQLAGG